MEIFFISIYFMKLQTNITMFPSPMGSFFISIVCPRKHLASERQSFRPLWGSSLFLWTQKRLQRFLKPRFRPLWGSFLFILQTWKMMSSMKTVSVPYGDLFYLYDNCTPITRKIHNGFPSPMGIFFIYIKSLRMIQISSKIVSVPYGDLFYLYSFFQKMEKCISNQFPSPMGIFFIYIDINDTVHQ